MITSCLFTTKRLTHLLTEAVYSDQLTGTEKGSSKEKYIERLPYYILVKRIFGERDATNLELSQQLDTVKRR